MTVRPIILLKTRILKKPFRDRNVQCMSIHTEGKERFFNRSALKTLWFWGNLELVLSVWLNEYPIIVSYVRLLIWFIY